MDLLCNSNDVETVVVLRDKKVDGHINIDLDVEKLGIHDNKATYDEIEAYVSEKCGYKVSSLYIAQVKEKAGIPLFENYNNWNGLICFFYSCICVNTNLLYFFY